jgi:Methyltransferase small domain
MLTKIDNPAQLKLDLFTTVARSENTAPIIFQPIPKPRQLPNLKLAEKLEKLAAGMQKIIDNKLNPAIGKQNITERRSRIAAGMREEGQKLAVIQRWLEGLAQAHRNGTCPDQFLNVNNRKQLEDLAWIYAWEKDDPKYLENCFIRNYSIVERLAQVGIKSKDEAIAAVDLLENLSSGNPAPAIDPSIQTAIDLRRKAIFDEVPDFFPTPKGLIDRMLEIAEVKSSHRVLDPSAGAGDICLAVRELGVSTIDCFEINWDLVQVLALLGFQLLARDFLTATPRPIYDRVVMNPPFSKDAYIDHVRAAYHWLAPGGELITVLPNGYCGSRITKRREFTDWLDDLGVDRYENQANPFTKSDRSCGVSTHLIHIKR